MLSASFISTILGTKLPGPGCIYVSQDIQFKAPVRAGDTVTARAEIVEIVPEKRRVVLKTTCSVGGKVVIDGKAVALVPTRARTAAV
jgi:3-hydroxybutyryl-CoA dehydratase